MPWRKRSLHDFSEELQSHLALEIDRLRAEGLSEDEAALQARRNLGNIVASEERFYEAGRWLWLDHFTQDLRYALRRLRKTPAFTLVAALTLALGIGATTAIFTLVHAVMLKSLPVAKPEQLYRIGSTIHCCVWGGYSQDGEFSLFSYELYQHFRYNTAGLEEMAAFSADVGEVAARRAGHANAAEPCVAEFVSGNYFSTLGVSALAGRTITPADDHPGATPVAVMSYAAWREKYGADPSIIGSVFNLNNTPFRVAGIAPPGFFGERLRGGFTPVFWLPLAAEPAVRGDGSILDHPDLHWLGIMGRIRAGSNPNSIEAQLRVELRNWLMRHAGDMLPNDRANISKQTTHLSPGGAGVTALRYEYEDGLLLLIIVSGAVLLIVSANLANLMLVRGIERRQQTALSVALGAPRARLVGQALVESIVLALIGGAAGVALAFAGTRGILRIAFPAASFMDINADPSLPVLLFAFAVSVATGIAFGIAPAWLSSRSDPAEALRGANRSTSDTGSVPRRALVILQAALSLALLSSAGLLTRSLHNLQYQNYGFARDGRWIVRFDPLLAGYKPEQLELLYRQMHDRLAGIPGVMNLSYSLYFPMSGDSWNDEVYIQGQAPPGPNDDFGTSWDRVGPNYFEIAGHRILRGRPLTEQDTAGSRHVAVVNETFARRFFKNQDPIGKHFGKGGLKYAADYEIVGVAADARYDSWSLRDPVRPMFFLPAAQATQYTESNNISGEVRSHYFHIVELQVAPGARALEGEVRRAFAEIDPNLTVVLVQSVSEMVKQNFSQQELITRLTLLFGLLALILAAIGVYGVTAYAVGRRTAEIGIRMALGADRNSVLALVLRSALALLSAGLGLGVLLTLIMSRFLGNQLYGVPMSDPVVHVVSICVLAVSASAAAFIPARRAASMAPMDALRTE